MKNSYLVLSAIFGLLGLIIAFENIMLFAPVLIIFKQINSNLFFPLALMFVIGFFAGMFFGFSRKEGKCESGEGDEFDI